MEKAISAAEANRKFSQLLREVKEGRTYVVTSHGRPVARISPVWNGVTVANLFAPKKYDLLSVLLGS